ncbi:NAD(P)-dependent alcohol dehydrogenase [Pleurocapsa sp. FMAR1]|uniref:NAD(P)-dependent alcohol dehydrogenase n=1 Tax=Pleurocapsa sp. FMAR1 TaxID=3040204 RepID=UPI0029C8B8F2|nr:NAD(P)-dependent alcohol dehydrogenase [Pleurocapsa sp. FMAR1]
MTIKGYGCKEQGGQLESFEYDPGELAADAVEVEVEYCGICHSDLAMIDNDWGISSYPFIPGHEAIGKIVAVGTQVSQDRIGQRVGVGWQSASCNHCKNCGVGKESLCLNQGEVGQTIVGRNGAWANRVRSQAHWAIPLPDQLDPSLAGPLMCAGTTVWSPIRHYGVRPGMETAVLGVGGLGHLAVQFLAKMGTQVTGLSTTRSKEKNTRKLGATDFIATKESPEDLEKAVGRFDFILSTVSANVDWNAYINALSPEGTLVLCGVPDGAVEFMPFPIILGEKKVGGGRAGSPSDTKEMLEFCAVHNIAPMCEQFALKDINQAVQYVRDNKARFRAVLAY